MNVFTPIASLITQVSPTSAITVFQTVPVMGLDNLDSVTIQAEIRQATGGTLDVFVQGTGGFVTSAQAGVVNKRKTAWIDMIHFPQLVSGSASVHQADQDPVVVTTAVDLPSCILAANALATAYSNHIASTFSHVAADATDVLGAPWVPLVSTTTESAMETLLNTVRTQYIAHCALLTSHGVADATNNNPPVAASNNATACTLANALTTKFNAHTALAPVCFSYVMNIGRWNQTVLPSVVNSSDVQAGTTLRLAANTVVPGTLGNGLRVVLVAGTGTSVGAMVDIGFFGSYEV